MYQKINFGKYFKRNLKTGNYVQISKNSIKRTSGILGIRQANTPTGPVSALKVKKLFSKTEMQTEKVIGPTLSMFI